MNAKHLKPLTLLAIASVAWNSLVYHRTLMCFYALLLPYSDYVNIFLFEHIQFCVTLSCLSSSLRGCNLNTATEEFFFSQPCHHFFFYVLCIWITV